MSTRNNIAFVAALLIFLSAPVWPAVKPHALFSDNAVLQRDISIPIWGTAASGEKVTVKFLNQAAITVARTDGNWMVRLKPVKAGGPFAMTISGENTIELKNILVGDVWVCSGQSNMEWPLAQAENGKEAIDASRDTQIRLLTTPNITADSPNTDIQTSWVECGPGTVDNFSAVGYFFGRDLRKNLNVPIGLINTSWGGTPVEAWTSRDALPSDSDLETLVKSLPDEPFRKPCKVYNGKIAPLIPYAIRGAIWYQGENNAFQGFLYRKRLPDMIRDWREKWGQGDFPFLLVQLAPFQKGDPEPNGSSWAELRESQLVTSLTCPKTAMTVITDLGDPKDIHPRRKEAVGGRLALAARGIAYGRHIIYRGPVYKSMKAKGDSITLYFDSVGDGLEARGGTLTGFTIAGVDQKFYPAEAAIINANKVVVKSAQVTKPMAVRYGWCIYPEVNLFNKDGLPASPFRTDSFQLSTQPKR